MPRLVILSDAHLLMQAEWLENEKERVPEGEEALENFRRALDKVRRTKPDAVLLAGDMFDYRTKSGRKVAHREGEKYMADVRDLLENLADDCGCRIYALKGNHDSEPVLKSIERALKGKFIFVDNKAVDLDGVSIYFMRTHYEPGEYDITELPNEGEILLMHEQIRIRPAMPGLPNETLRELSVSYKLVLNGHVHFFGRGVLGITNLIQVPALIPSREIKEGWMYKLAWKANAESVEYEERPSPFGFVVVENFKVGFKRCTPINKVVHVEICGEKASDLLEGLRAAYDYLMELPDRSNMRVWIKTDADRITIKRLLWPEVRKYQGDIFTVDILPLPRERVAKREGPPSLRIEGKAFTRSELVEMVLASLSGREKKIATRIFEEVLTTDLLGRERHNKLDEFMSVVRIAAENLEVSEAFFERVRKLARRFSR